MMTQRNYSQYRMDIDANKNKFEMQIWRLLFRVQQLKYVLYYLTMIRWFIISVEIIMTKESLMMVCLANKYLYMKLNCYENEKLMDPA